MVLAIRSELLAEVGVEVVPVPVITTFTADSVLVTVALLAVAWPAVSWVVLNSPTLIISKPPKSWSARIGVWPSLATDAVKAVAISDSVLFIVVDEITDPVMNGFPAGSV